MVEVEIIDGDILDSNIGVIVQQLNCISVRPHGLSEQIAKKYPYANVYCSRLAMDKRNICIPEHRGTPGEIVISYPFKSSKSKSEKPIVVGLYGQYDYGKAGHSSRTNWNQDNPLLRVQWFKECLSKLKTWMIDEGHPTVAFPYGIGCGLAGGNWKRYSKMIENFAQNAPFKVKIYKLNYECN